MAKTPDPGDPIVEIDNGWRGDLLVCGHRKHVAYTVNGFTCANIT